jgi:hypothetical protein
MASDIKYPSELRDRAKRDDHVLMALGIDTHDQHLNQFCHLPDATAAKLFKFVSHVFRHPDAVSMIPEVPSPPPVLKQRARSMDRPKKTRHG